MEACDAYKPWHDKATHTTDVRADSGKCLHYYFYFMDAAFGLIYLRVPTYCPFRLQFYCNGHSWLARQLTAAGIGHSMVDNAFARIDDWPRAQELANGFSPDLLHQTLDHYARQCCPVTEVFGHTYHWSLMQVEYATDLAFRSVVTLGPLYQQLVRQSVISVKADQVASFLGRQITPQLAQEIGSQFATRIEGTCVKTPLRQRRRSRCTTSRYGVTDRNHSQRRVVFQAPPHGGTPRPASQPRARSGQENHLQSDRSARDPARLQQALPRPPVRTGRLLRRACGRCKRLTKPRGRRGQTVKGINFFEPSDKTLLQALQKPAGQHRRHPPWRSPCGPADVLAGTAIAPTVAVARDRW